MRTPARLIAGSLLIALAGLTAGQMPPLVPLADPGAEEAFLPGGVTRAKPELFGDYVHVWGLEDGTQVFQYYGDFALHLGSRRLKSRDAVVWMGKTVWNELNYYSFQVFLSREAYVRDAAGTVTTGPTLLVTFNSFEPAVIEADSSTTQPSVDSTLYREADRVRSAILSGRAATRPIEMEVVDPTAESRPKPPEAKPLVRYRADQEVIDEKAGLVTATGNVYLSQGLVDSTTVVEIRADAAVLFLTKTEEKPSAPSDPLAIDAGADRASAAGPTGLPTAGDIAGFGGGAGTAVAGAYLRGDVVLTRGDRMIRSPELYYDFENDRALILDAVMRAGTPDGELPIYVRAEQVRQLSSTEYLARKARVTTSEFYTPHVHIGAERVYLTDATPRDESGQIIGLAAGKYRMYDATFNVEGVPIAYWPYAAGDFRQGETSLRGVRFSYGDDFGASVESKWYLFNLLGMEKPEGVNGILRLDYFGKRGPGVGLDLDYENEHSYGLVRGYYINDHGEDNLGPFRDGEPDTENRGRFTVRHREYLPKGWELTLEGSYVSDPTFLEEYFRSEFEEGKEQETLVYLKKQQDNWAFTALAQWRVLDFLTQTEHLPDAGFHWIGQPLGEIASYFNESHLGLLRYKPDNRRIYARDRFDDNEWESDITFRGDTRNEVDVPIKLGNFNVVPYAMGRTGYWDASVREGSVGRLFGQMGVRTGTQFWRVFENAVSKLLDVNGVRHIIKPEITAWLSSSNVDSLDLYPFDRGVEDIDDFYGASFALRQRWQTKRGSPGKWRTVDWITLDLEVNAFGNAPKYENSVGRFYDYRPENSNARDHVRADFSYRLSDTTAILADGNFDLTDGDMDLFNISYAVEHTPRFSYVFGYRRIGDTDSNLIGFGSNYEINVKHRVAVRAYYDVERSELETFDITLIRKFPRWFAAVTFDVDRVEDNIGVSLSVWPEGAPDMALGSRRYSGLSRSTGIRPEE